jgi:hypothetical protein
MPFSLSIDRYADAMEFHAYIAVAKKNVELWNGLYRTLPLPQRFVDRARAVPGRWHLLVLSEDWCGDAVNTVPLIARLVEDVPSLDLRILPRDQNLDVMAEHLTNGTKSIPVVIVLDEHFVEHGWWGPRPTELQAWVLSEGVKLPKDERYRATRRWYARDRGETTLEEVVSLLERAAGAGNGPDVGTPGFPRGVGGSPGH